MQKEILSTLQALKKALETSPEDVVVELLEMVIKTTNADTARLWIEDPEKRDYVKCVASVPIDYEKWKKIKELRVRKSLKIVSDSLKNPAKVYEKLINGNSKTKDSYAKVTEQKGVNLVCGIELGGKHNTGLIAIDFGEKQVSKQELVHAKEALETSTTLIGLLFTNENWLTNLEKLSKMDELTRIYNVREYRTQLDSEINKRKKGKDKSPLFLAEFDIDDFKQINDNYESHVVGDIVLERLGKRITKFIDDNNLSEFMHAYRRGGDEFAILIWAKNRNECRDIISELFKNLTRNMSIKREKETLTIPISISMGCGMFEDRYTSQDFKNTIDARVYYAKKTGKNKIIGQKEHNI
ncbi:GGDEF domain-containing protein [Candidatus Micrarchaeota archaeon]|jgi:diguanylate cyclase (GGDEF)-like protein|nr:GGDEF domain-containing protein [Candidatus Micrarchaeota archaeon]